MASVVVSTRDIIATITPPSGKYFMAILLKIFACIFTKKLYRSYSTSQAVLIVIAHWFSQNMFYLILHLEYWTQKKPHETS